MLKMAKHALKILRKVCLVSFLNIMNHRAKRTQALQNSFQNICCRSFAHLVFNFFITKTSSDQFGT